MNTLKNKRAEIILLEEFLVQRSKRCLYKVTEFKSFIHV